MEEESKCGNEVDREDPLLITTVRARLNREEKVKKVGRKTVKRLVNLKTDDDEKGGEEPPSIVNPRRYQQEAFNAALKKNIILYLETGGGKTLVAVLLIKALAKNTRPENGSKRLIVFLAPTVILVQQQSRVVKIHTDLKVGEFYGAKNVDSWGSVEWESQISDIEVMVMTPQVLLNNLQHGFMKMDVIELLIFDECHHAYKNHAYAQIMKGFYHTNVNNGRLPKIFGMTASPVTKKGVKTYSEAAGQLSGLEDMLKSEVFTLKDREEVEFVAPTASTIEEHYDAPNLKIIASFKERIEALLKKCEGANMEALTNTNLKVGFKDQADLIEKLKEKINKFHRDLQFCLEELGLWCAFKAAEHSFKVDNGVNDFDGFGAAAQAFKRNKDLFLKESLQLLQSAVPEDWASVRSAQELRGAVSKGYLTPKVYQLVAILFQKRLTTKDPKCIIFVERRMAAVVIASLVNQVKCLSELLFAEAIYGANAGVDTTRGQQQRIVASFNRGEINLLVATDIAEEGLDVQTCSEVIRFDLPKTLRSNIQSRGRARQQGSTYIVFLERGNVTQKEQFSKILRSEPVMREEIISREHMPANSRLIVCPSPETYRVASTGASVTPDSSVNLILRFCAKLPSDKFYMPKPEYISHKVGSQHKCDLKLPPASPIHDIEGDLQSNPSLAKQLTALKACKLLHKIGALNDHLVPSVDFELGDEEEEKFSKSKSASGVGTTMQKELYPSAEAEIFSGNWHTLSGEAVKLYSYCISFDIQPMDDEAYANFVLLTGHALDDDVAKLATDLFLTRGRKVTAKISPRGVSTFSADQLHDAKIFQTVLFNGMFSKMSKSAQATRKRKRGSSDISSLFIDRADLWNSNNAYLLLPAATTTFDKSSIPIDWKIVHSTSSAVKSLAKQEDNEILPPRKKYSFLKSITELFTHRQEQQLQPQDGSLLTLAGNLKVTKSEVADAAILTLHTMMIYPVVAVVHDTTARSPFPFRGEENFNSYADFFQRRYGITLQHPNQPLLQLKQNHRAHNLLPTSPGLSGKDAGKAVSAKKPAKKGANGSEVLNAKNSAKTGADESEVPKTHSASVEMPPELCLVLGFSAAVIRSAYWVPSVMHRIKAAVLACQLRHSISAPQIPVMEVLKALTTTRCNESFNMEALELFGDSFLKYAVSRKLFLELQIANEGILSTKRMHRICNRALHQLAVQRGLPGYIRDCPFDPSRWAAPGMFLSREVVCHCKQKQMFQAFESTTSKVIGVFGAEKLTEKIQTDTIKPRIGLTCDKGHRYLCSKTVADVMEALIGAYLQLGKNCDGALKFMIWAGIDVDYDPSLMVTASRNSPVDLSCDYGVDVKALERRIGYSFRNKYLPLEAMTHPSNMGGDRVHCYQRLEFLGDAVLDFLLTRHLFTSHPTSSPGLLTSLRSASVNNERFARVAVKHKLHCYLRHGSGLLLHQIEEFAKSIEAAGDDETQSSFGLHGIEAPKVLGDVVESIAGAIAVDTCFDLDKVWAVMKPLLEPIVTPATLDMHPVTELEEFCSGAAYNLKCIDENSKDGRACTVKYEVHITEDLCIDGISRQPKKKIAKKDAAAKVLVKLKTPGFKEKFGKPIVKFEPEVETCEALATPPIAEGLKKLPEKKSEVRKAQECGEILRKEMIEAERKLGPQVNSPSVDRLLPEKKSELRPCTDDKQSKVFQDAQVTIGKVWQGRSENGTFREQQNGAKGGQQREGVQFTQRNGLTKTVLENGAAKGVQQHEGVKFPHKNGSARAVQENGVAKGVQQHNGVKFIQKKGVAKAVQENRAPKGVQQLEGVKYTHRNGVAQVVQENGAPRGVQQRDGVKITLQNGVSIKIVQENGATTKAVQQRESVKLTQQNGAVNVVQQRDSIKITQQNGAVETTLEHETVQVRMQGEAGNLVQTKIGQQTTKELPLPASMEFGRGRDLKRKVNITDLGDNKSAKFNNPARFSWSQDAVVQTQVTNSTEMPAKRCKPAGEAIDKLNFCPWTGALPSESFVQGRSTTTKSGKGTVDVFLPGKVLFPSVQPAKKPVPAHKSKQSWNKAASSSQSNTKAAVINCRQILNEIRMKHKWSNPVFKLMNEVDTSHVPRFRFSLTVDTGKDKYECQGETKTDKKQGMESAASTMLTILKQKGVSGLP